MEVGFLLSSFPPCLPGHLSAHYSPDYGHLVTALFAGNKTARLEDDEQPTNEKPGWTHATESLQTREIYAPGTCQTRG